MASDAVRDRAQAAIIGALVADAAVHPTQWVYDVGKLTEALKGKSEPEFNSEWLCPFYVYENGRISVYGDQAFILLKSLVENKGFDARKYMEALLKDLGPGSPYDLALSSSPRKGPWRNSHITKSLPSMQAGNIAGGVDQAESDAYAMVPPLVAMYAGSEKLDNYIEQAVRITLNNDCSVRTAQFFGKLLEHYILQGPDPDAVRKVLENVPDDEHKVFWQTAYNERSLPHSEAVQKFGLACGIPGSFQGVLNGIMKNEDYVSAVRSALRAGGANAPRALGIGACAAAQHGRNSIPTSWIARTLKGKEIVTLAEELAKRI